MKPLHRLTAQWALLGLAVFCLSGCQTARQECCPAKQCAPASTLEEKWGIQVASLHLSAGGNMVDFRYRVVDTEKAAWLLNNKGSFCLIDQASGKQFTVPTTPKLGPLRQSTDKLTAGKIYFVLFANPGKFVKSTDKVTVAMGDFRVENLTVE